MNRRSSPGYIMLDAIAKLSDDDLDPDLEASLGAIYEQMGKLRQVAPFYVAQAAIEVIPPGLDFGVDAMSQDEVDEAINASVNRFGNIAFRLLGQKSLSFASDAYIRMLSLRIGPSRNPGDLNHTVVRSLSMHPLCNTKNLEAVIKGIAGSYLHTA